MTDNEIIKALECCFLKTNCTDCPCYVEKPYAEDCLKFAAKNAIDLLKRQKAEIEELREIIFTDRTEAIKLLKSEAIKEFAERLKEHFETYADDEETNVIHMRNLIDNLVKEKTGEKT